MELMLKDHAMDLGYRDYQKVNLCSFVSRTLPLMFFLLPGVVAAEVSGDVWQEFYGEDRDAFTPIGNQETLQEEIFHPKILTGDIIEFRRRLQQLFSMRIELLNLIERLKVKIEQHQPFTSSEVSEVNQQFTLRLEIRNQFIDLIDRYIPFIRNDELEPTFRHKGVFLSLALNLVLIDDHDTVLRFFQQEERLRRIINGADPDSERGEDQLWESLKKFHKLRYLFAKIKGIKIFRKYHEQFQSEMAGDSEFDFLNLVITGSETYQEYVANPNSGYLSELWRHFSLIYWHRRLASEDQARWAIEALSTTASAIFGNAVGQVGWRRGKLDGDMDLLHSLATSLQPLDILTEKTPFRLTDSFIPGFWGHNALWLGSKGQLVELGLWAHPSITPHHQLIEQGYGIIEALRPGVKLSSLLEFTNIDSFSLLRKSIMSEDELKKGIVEAFSHIGKPYDFAYDIQTADAMICSEIIYWTFESIVWPTRYYVGRWTLLPDDVASRTQMGGPLSVELLYVDGKKIVSDLLAEMEVLLNNYQR